MGRYKNRFGKGQLRTAAQLAEDTAIGAYLIIQGSAEPHFLNSDRPHPGQPVVIRGIRADALYPPAAHLPVWVHWEQWKKVVAPVIEDPSTGWAGIIRKANDPVTLPVTVYSPDGSVAQTSSGLSLTAGTVVGTKALSNAHVGELLRGAELMKFIRGMLLQRATEAGY
jgi:hypothetical protein|tara:strand:- start:5488 stop:5991 length:504 start_codon:yes stop_codon:yes gene_type:complete